MEGIDPWVPVIGFCLLFAFGPPSLIYVTQVFRAEGACRLLTSDFHVPESVESEMDVRRRELKELGFDSRGIIILSGAKNAAALVENFVNAISCDVANVTFVYGFVQDGRVINSVKYVEFSRRFRQSDFDLLNTNNLSQPGVFPDEPNRLSFRLPMVQHADELYGLHLQLVQRHAGNARPYIRVDEEFSGDLVRFWEAVSRESYNLQIGHGLMKYDIAGRIWRPTLLGAFRFAHQVLPPLKQIRTMQLRARARRVLAELQWRNES